MSRTSTSKSYKPSSFIERITAGIRTAAPADLTDTITLPSYLALAAARSLLIEKFLINWWNLVDQIRAPEVQQPSLVSSTKTSSASWIWKIINPRLICVNQKLPPQSPSLQPSAWKRAPSLCWDSRKTTWWTQRASAINRRKCKAPWTYFKTRLPRWRTLAPPNSLPLLQSQIWLATKCGPRISQSPSNQSWRRTSLPFLVYVRTYSSHHKSSQVMIRRTVPLPGLPWRTSKEATWRKSLMGIEILNTSSKPSSARQSNSVVSQARTWMVQFLARRISIVATIPRLSRAQSTKGWRVQNLSLLSQL